MKSIYLFLFVSIILSACTEDNFNTEKTSLDQITSLADTYVVNFIKFFPEQSSYYNLENADHLRLSDNSLANIEKWKAFEDSLYAELTKKISKPEVGTEAWYLYGILKEALESSIELRICRQELMPVNQLQGWQVLFITVISNQPVGSESTRQMAIKRWKGIGQYIDIEINNLKTGIGLNYTVPKDIVKIVINQLDKMLQEPYEKSGFYNPAIRDSSIEFKQEWLKLVKDDFYPVMKKYKDFLKNEYLPKARENISISGLPGGEKCFEAYYRYNTSLKKNAKEILETSEFQFKLYELKLKLKGKNTYGTDSLPLILKKISLDSTQYFKSKDEILPFIKALIKKAENKCPSYFNKLPLGKLEVEIVPENLEEQHNSYYIPSLNNSGTPSIFYVNLNHPEKKLKGNIETSVFHETFPGHHLQLGLVVEKKSNHLITKILGVTGYIEGWASYAQVLAQEMELYSTEFSSLLVTGRSAAIMRLEAGIHAENWTREEGIKFLKSTINPSEDIANVIIDRTIAWPGQYSTYGAGLTEMLELRELAKITLADKFNIKEFHEVILEDGSIPLEMLREKVNWWLEKKKKQE